MGLYTDFFKCPQCGGIVKNEFNIRTGEENEWCLRCGRWAETHLPKNADESKLAEDSGFVVKIEMGLGRCLITSANGFGRSFSLSEPYSKDIEKWFMETMARKDVDLERSYLTRWDEETGQIVVVHGKDPGLYNVEHDDKENLQ